MITAQAPLSRTLSDQVADRLRSAILGGRLGPGQRIVEQEIAQGTATAVPLDVALAELETRFKA